MAFDYYTLQPHRLDLVPSNRYRAGRQGRKPRYIVRHHLMMVNATGEQVRGVWLNREASAHYTVQGAAGRVGQISQHVYDANTAFANADWDANLESYTIEHSNSTGKVNNNDYDPGSWNINDEVIKSGARWAAALLVHDKMGPPVYGPNGTIRDHNMFTSTGCPVHLSGPHRGNPWGGNAGKYHHGWLEECEWFYGQLSKRLVNPDGTPINSGTPAPVQEGDSMFGPEQVGALHEAKVAAQEAREVLDGEYASLINPEHAFTLAEYATLIDAATWEQRKLSEAIAKKLGLDPDTIIEEAIKADRGEK